MKTQKAEEVELAPLKIGRKTYVKIPLPVNVYRKISETVRRFSTSASFGLWRITLYAIFMKGYDAIENDVGLEKFVDEIYIKKQKQRMKKGMGESRDA